MVVLKEYVGYARKRREKMRKWRKARREINFCKEAIRKLSLLEKELDKEIYKDAQSLPRRGEVWLKSLMTKAQLQTFKDWQYIRPVDK